MTGGHTETVLEVGPLPHFLETRRERQKSSNIWVVKFAFGVYVSRSVPAIVRVLNERGFSRWESSIYRGTSKLCVVSKCKTVDEVNAALEGVQRATFIVVDHGNWICEEKNAANISGDSSAA